MLVKPSARRITALICAVLVSSCGGDSGDGGALDAGGFVDDRPIALRGECPLTERGGRFRLEVISEGSGAGSFLSGDIFDLVDPTLKRTVVSTAGDCELLRRENPLCDPSCTAEQFCSAEASCIPRARGIDGGPVRVGGLASNITMDARAPGNNYFDTELAHPAVSGGEEIRLRADGDSLGTELAIDGLGSEPLTETGDGWVLTTGQDLTVSWAAPTGSAPKTTVAIRLSIDQHGTTPVTLTCEFDDDGGAVVPAAVIDELLGAGISGFANGLIERRTSDAQSLGDRCVDFQVAHTKRQPASVTGHTPCNVPNDCPTGQVCDLEQRTCIDE